MENILSILTFVGTLITALATFLTVREIKKQREASYFPDLYLGSQLVFVYGEKYKDVILPVRFYDHQLEDDNYALSNNITIDLFNVGLAAAKSIFYEWSFDMKAALDQIAISDSISYFNIKGDEMLNVSIPEIGFSHIHMVENQTRKTRINYILPSSIEKDPTKIPVPSSYIDLNSIYLFTSFGFHTKPVDSSPAKKYIIDLNKFPPLILSLTYNDLNGKPHSKKFRLRFELFTFFKPDINKPENSLFSQQRLALSDFE